jgi:alkylation response protein AidB-like acyl-CoA dehydrogenase
MGSELKSLENIENAISPVQHFSRSISASHPDGQSDTLAAVVALAEEVAARSADGEQDACLAADIVEQLGNAGIFRMMVPKTYGGDALTPLQVSAVIEELAAADAAAAWTAMVAVGFNILLSRYPKEVLGDVFKNGPDVRMRGAIAPMGKATRTEGGYIVSGRWPFGSGPYQPEWMFGGCIIQEDGKPVMGDRGPKSFIALFPAKHAEFLDTWDTVGLRGTDSRDYTVSDVFVPDSHAVDIFDFGRPSTFDGEIFNLPFPMVAGPTHSAVCLGILRASLHDLTILAKTKRSAHNPGATLAENPVFAYQLTELAVRYASLDALHVEQVRGLDYLASGQEPFNPAFHLPRSASWAGYIHQETTKLMNDIVELAGSVPVYKKSRLQQRWRDARVAAAHSAGSKGQYSAYGTALANA